MKRRITTRTVTYTFSCGHELVAGSEDAAARIAAAFREGSELDCRSCDVESGAPQEPDRFAGFERRVRPTRLGDHRPGVDPPITGTRRRADAPIHRRTGRPLEGGILDYFPSGWDGPGWYVELENGGWHGAFDSRSEAVEWSRAEWERTAQERP